MAPRSRTIACELTTHTGSAAFASQTIALLTRRELEIAQLLTQGRTDREIADEIFVSPRTVGVHVHHILRKCGLRSRAEVGYWLETHSADAPDPGESPSLKPA